MFSTKQKAEMARRIKAGRNGKGLSHKVLAETLSEKYNIRISSDVLKNYEVSNEHHTKFGSCKGMNVEYLSCLADFYNVSTDYLLGISDVKDRDESIQTVCSKTGLTERAVRRLISIHSARRNLLLSKVIEHSKFDNFLWWLASYSYAKREPQINIIDVLSIRQKADKDTAKLIATPDVLITARLFQCEKKIEEIIEDVSNIDELFIEENNEDGET